VCLEKGPFFWWCRLFQRRQNAHIEACHLAKHADKCRARFRATPGVGCVGEHGGPQILQVVIGLDTRTRQQRKQERRGYIPRVGMQTPLPELILESFQKPQLTLGSPYLEMVTRRADERAESSG
jgi:hypothetical protein